VYARRRGGGSARAAFFAAHPNSTYYADFRDFAFWKLQVEHVRYTGVIAMVKDARSRA
jgi:hypothetical protein